MDISQKNQVNIYDCFTIIFLAFITNVFSELLSWAFIYRKRKYKDCKKLIDTLTRKIEISKESIKGRKNTDKKLKSQEAELKSLNMDMMKV